MISPIKTVRAESEKKLMAQVEKLEKQGWKRGLMQRNEYGWVHYVYLDKFEKGRGNASQRRNASAQVL